MEIKFNQQIFQEMNEDKCDTAFHDIEFITDRRISCHHGSLPSNQESIYSSQNKDHYFNVKKCDIWR